MAFILAVLIMIGIAFATVGIILIPYFYGCYILWLKLSLSWKIILPIIYISFIYLAIKCQFFQVVAGFFEKK